MKTGIEMIAERESKIFTANGMSREELRLNYNAACNAYQAAFCEKHGAVCSYEQKDGWFRIQLIL